MAGDKTIGVNLVITEKGLSTLDAAATKLDHVADEAKALAAESEQLSLKQTRVNQGFEDVGNSAGRFALSIANAKDGTLNLGKVMAEGGQLLDGFGDRLERAKASGASLGGVLQGVGEGALVTFVSGFAVPKIIEFGQALYDLRQEAVALEETLARNAEMTGKQTDQYVAFARSVGMSAEELKQAGAQNLSDLGEMAEFGTKLGKQYEAWRQAQIAAKQAAVETKGPVDQLTGAQEHLSVATERASTSLRHHTEATHEVATATAQATRELDQYEQAAQRIAAGDAARAQARQAEQDAYDKRRQDNRNGLAGKVAGDQAAWMAGINTPNVAQSAADAYNTQKITRSMQSDSSLMFDADSPAIKRAIERLSHVSGPAAAMAAEALRGGNANALQEAAQASMANARNFASANVDAANIHYGQEYADQGFALSQILRELKATLLGPQVGSAPATGGGSSSGAGGGGLAHAMGAAVKDALAKSPISVQIDGKEVAKAIGFTQARHA